MIQSRYILKYPVLQPRDGIFSCHPSGEIITSNLQQIHQRISAAASRVNRDPATIQLIAVTKYTTIEAINQLLELGHLELGESRPQQLVERHQLFSPEVHWHFIGNLQRIRCSIYSPSPHSSMLLTLLNSWNELNSSR